MNIGKDVYVDEKKYRMKESVIKAIGKLYRTFWRGRNLSLVHRAEVK